MKFEHFDHRFAHVEHVDKFFRTQLVLDTVSWLEVEDSTFISHIWNWDKVLCDGEGLIQDFTHIVDGVEFEHPVKLDGSRLLGLVEGR